MLAVQDVGVLFKTKIKHTKKIDGQIWKTQLLKGIL
jgi:hypothetical protein